MIYNWYFYLFKLIESTSIQMICRGWDNNNRRKTDSSMNLLKSNWTFKEKWNFFSMYSPLRHLLSDSWTRTIGCEWIYCRQFSTNTSLLRNACETGRYFLTFRSNNVMAPSLFLFLHHNRFHYFLIIILIWYMWYSDFYWRRSENSKQNNLKHTFSLLILVLMLF